MIWFVFKVILAIAMIITAKALRSRASKAEAEEGEGRRRSSESKLPPQTLRLISRALIPASIVIGVWAIVSTSVVWVPQGSIATMNRVYLGTSLPPGRIVALKGELGPQAEIMTAGFKFRPFINLTHKVAFEPVFNVPPGMCAIMSAKDGLPASGGSAFAEPWTDQVRQKMANDATYFLTEGKGQRGPQTSVLMPGMYTVNPYLWEKPQVIEATRIEQGTVGVVKSSVRVVVDFGAFKRPLPTDDMLHVIDKILPVERAKALLVPVGAIGVWEEPLPNGLYYINTEAYKVTHVPTIAQVYEYKGGYKKRTVTVSVDAKGQIKEEIVETEVQAVPESADTAIFTKPEGWDVPQELRTMVQISPAMAPFVTAALGLTGENTAKVIEDRVVTPVLRSVVRDVLGGAQIPFKQQRAVLGADGKPVLDEATGQPKTELVHEFRAVKVMDLLEQRPSLEAAIEERAKPEAEKEGVTIMQVLLAESAIPAELLLARKREQLAQQLTKAWAQEEIAQTQRQAVENARAQAEQQAELVKADIAAQAAKKRAEARTTEGEGEKAYLMAIAEGQKAQAEVLGEEVTARLQMYQQGLKFTADLAEKNPEMLAAALNNATKFVPSVVVNNGGGTSGSGSLEGPAAIFGYLLGTGGMTKVNPATTQAAKPQQ